MPTANAKGSTKRRSTTRAAKRTSRRRVIDTTSALRTLRDGIHPGTPFGVVCEGETHRDAQGVPQINKAEAQALAKAGLAVVTDSQIRLAA